MSGTSAPEHTGDSFAADDDEHVRAALQRLSEVVARFPSACVAFSGGVDSSVVLAVSQRVLGADHVVAFTAASETYRPDELEAARALARALGVRHVVRATRELDDERFVANPPARCAYCKEAMVATLRAVASETGMMTLLDGANRDDLNDVRPGMRRASELGVQHPLVEAGLGKAEVRALARYLHLSTADKPQEACLASRIPYGSPITAEKLRTIAAAEAVLRRLGFTGARVRHHGSIARIEVGLDEVERAAGAPARDELVRQLRALGFTYVTLDLQGFRSGSMNEVLQADERAPTL